MSYYSSPPWQQPEVIQLNYRMFKSFEYWLKRPLIEEIEDSPEAIAEALFEAPFVLVCQDAQPDPLSNYANRMALERFDMKWEELIQLPSRHATQPLDREERKQFLKAMKNAGCLPNVLISLTTKNGERFRIKNCILWNVLDEQQQYCGQAIIYKNWSPLEKNLSSFTIDTRSHTPQR